MHRGFPRVPSRNRLCGFPWTSSRNLRKLQVFGFAALLSPVFRVVTKEQLFPYEICCLGFPRRTSRDFLKLLWYCLPQISGRDRSGLPRPSGRDVSKMLCYGLPQISGRDRSGLPRPSGRDRIEALSG